MRRRDAAPSVVARLLLLGPLLAVIAFFALRDGLTQRLVDAGEARSALSFSPRSASAQALAADQEIQRSRAAPAGELAAKALASAPMNAAAMRVLALARDAQGDLDTASEALRLAGTLGWRDTPTQMLLLVAALQRHDAATAVQRADALGRRDKELDVAFAGLRAAALEPGGPALVAERLGQMPQYRLAFLKDVSKLMPGEYDAREAMLAALASGVAPATAEEVNPYVQLLLDRRDYARARRVWMRFSGQGNPRELLQDSSFDHLSSASNGFGWQVPGSSLPWVSVDDDVERGRSVLRVRSDGGPPEGLIIQVMTLPPGAHVFAFDATASAGEPLNAFEWVLRCLEGNQVIQLAPRRIGGQGRWTRFEAAFQVPAGCPLQRLELLTRPIELSGEVSAWFDRAEMR